MYLEDSSPVIRGGLPDESRWLDAMLDAIEQENQPPSNGQSRNHFYIVFPKEPSILEIRELVGIFSQPFPNPYR